MATMSGARRGASWKAAAAAALLLAVAACESDDPLAPEGSTIRVTADPQTVVSPGGGAPGRTTLTATVRSKSGTRLEGQEVTFSTTAGTLTPKAETPLLTDDAGQVTSFLDTSASATVTAASGTITATTNVNVITGNLSQITLDALPTSLSTCSTEVTLTVEATDVNGDGVANLTIVFVTSAPSGRAELQGTITPSQPRTDDFGIAEAIFRAEVNFCTTNCDTTDPNKPFGGACGLRVIAQDVSGSFQSPPVDITESFP